MQAIRKSPRPRIGRLTGFLGLATLATLGLAAPAAYAQTAYVDSFAPTTPGSGIDTFGTLNLQTGSFTSIGNLNTELFALGFGSDGTLYGLAPASGSGTDLYQVATDTGAETFVQNFTDFNVYGGSGNADGTFTAITQGTSANANRSSLFTVNPVAKTAAAGIMTFASADGLAVADGSGNVYVSDINTPGNGTDGLDLVNTAAKHPGTAFLGDTGLNNLYTGLFSGGQLYTFGNTPTPVGFGQVSGPEGIYTLDTDTGAATLVAATSNDQTILAAALAPAAVPEASTTVSFGLLLALGGLVVVKRRKASLAA